MNIDALENLNKNLHKQLWELEGTREAIRSRMVELYCIREGFNVNSLTPAGRAMILGEDVERKEYNEYAGYKKEIRFLVPKTLIGQIDESH